MVTGKEAPMAAGSSREMLQRVFYDVGSREELEKVYDGWAEQYDEDNLKFGYLMPSVAAGYVGRYVPIESRLIDAGVGTGMLGRVLKAMSYRDLTGLDMSQGMLDVARRTGAYAQLDRQVLGEPLSYDTNSFDVCVSVGTFTQNHAPVSGYDEIVRIVKPGGLFIVAIREDLYLNEGFQAKEEELTAAGVMRLVERSEKFRAFSDTPKDTGRESNVYVYRIA